MLAFMTSRFIKFLPGLLLAAHSLAAQDPVANGPDITDLPHAFDAGWKGEQTCEVLFEDENTRVGRCVFPPGTGHEKHYHNPHFGYTLEGSTLRLADNTGEREVTTSAGATWTSTTITVHEAINIGDTTTSYLIVEPKHSQ